jgi:hypothetical protein
MSKRLVLAVFLAATVLYLWITALEALPWRRDRRVALGARSSSSCWASGCCISDESWLLRRSAPSLLRAAQYAKAADDFLVR